MDDVSDGHFPIGQFSEQVWGFSSVSDGDMLQSIYSDTEAFSLDNGGATAQEIWWDIAADSGESAIAPDDFPAEAPDSGTKAAVASPIGGIDGRGKRRWAEEEDLSPPLLDKGAQRKVRKTTKNRESATRCRERKQAYTMGLESQVKQLEEENAKLLKEEAEWNKERYKQVTVLLQLLHFSIFFFIAHPVFGALPRLIGIRLETRT